MNVAAALVVSPQHDRSCHRFAVEETASQAHLAINALDLYLGLHALESERLGDIAEMQLPSPGSVDGDLTLHAFELDVVATTLQVHRTLYSLGADHVAPAHIYVQAAAEILDPHSGSVTIDVDIALKIVDVVVTVASS